MSNAAYDVSSARHRLATFRRVAAGIHPYVETHLGHRLSVQFDDPKGTSATLLPSATIDAMAVRVRNVYAQGETTHFLGICNIVSRLGTDLEARMSAVARKGWKRVINHPFLFQSGSNTYTGHDLLDAYLYGDLTHVHDDQYARLESLTRFGDLATMVLQSTVSKMCTMVISFDSVVASVLAESPLPCGPALPLTLEDVLTAEAQRQGRFGNRIDRTHGQ